jgi:hypothetical protein
MTTGGSPLSWKALAQQTDADPPEIITLFHVTIAVRIPHDVDPETIKQLSAQEHEGAKELQLEGTWPHLWRVAGKYANVVSWTWRTRANSTRF